MVAAHMLAAVKASAARGITLAEIDVPQPRQGEVLLRVDAASLCGTDTHIYEWDRWAANRVRPPLVVGHEICGTPVEVGAEAAEIRVGERYAVESHIVCRRCVPCNHGDYHACENTRILGVDINGGLSDYVIVPADNLRTVEQSLDPALVAMMEPLGNALHACDVRNLHGAVVTVLGCGPIGLGCIVIARARGAKRILAADPSPWRLRMAERLGADHTLEVSSATSANDLRGAAGGYSDCVLEMSGAVAAISAALEIVRPGGWISLLGLGDAPSTIDTSARVVMRGITVYGVVGRELWRTWDAMDVLMQDAEAFLPILTHAIELPNLEDAFSLMRHGECGKVVILPTNPQ
jgi:threonine 3-dehydrogenase